MDGNGGCWGLLGPAGTNKKLVKTGSFPYSLLSKGLNLRIIGCFFEVILEWAVKPMMFTWPPKKKNLLVVP